MQSIASMDACSNGKPSLGASYPLLRTRLGPEPTRLSYYDKTKVGSRLSSLIVTMRGWNGG